jgi:hypothetical protein
MTVDGEEGDEGCIIALRVASENFVRTNGCDTYGMTILRTTDVLLVGTGAWWYFRRICWSYGTTKNMVHKQRPQSLLTHSRSQPSIIIRAIQPLSP